MGDEALNKFEVKWNELKKTPHIKNRATIIAPQNSAVYRVGNIITEKLVLFGSGVKCRERMKALWGSSGRRNQSKIDHVLSNWEELE